MIYLDSSLLLTIYLSQPGAAEGRQVLGLRDPKVSSWLLAVEVPIVLRRALAGRPADRTLLDAALAAFDADVAALHLISDLPEIARRVRTDLRLSGCRALDALHVATALHVQEETGSRLSLATFDESQRRLASGLGLRTLPT